MPLIYQNVVIMNPQIHVSTCKSFIKKEECCNATFTKLTDCMFYECKNKTDPTKTLTGCYNVSDQSDQALINKTCDLTDKVNNTCAATPVVPTVSCRNFTKNVTECCKHGSDLGCVFVKCTGKDKAPFDGCYNKTEVTCAPLDDQCQAHTTEAPTTTSKPTTVRPTPEPVFEECQNLKNVKDCCGNELFKCIFVNCNGTTTKRIYNGCYSTTNQTTIQTECGTTFLDSCAAVAPTTAAPSTDRHFDGASFIGGIVLCAGIILIIFFVLKWYKSRQASSNYHQM
ncbi:sialomucin core protein 24-like [Mytilus edulis]|uniref:sialomucin core protein 24-like n=1 Tax=Mytilus edulis TaxID=6550 RepID=UPI0039EDF75C